MTFFVYICMHIYGCMCSVCEIGGGLKGEDCGLQNFECFEIITMPVFSVGVTVKFISKKIKK